MGFFTKKIKITGDTTVVLTSLGKEKAERYAGEGVKGSVLESLNTEGASAVTEIAQDCDISTSKAVLVIDNFVNVKKYAVVTKSAYDN